MKTIVNAMLSYGIISVPVGVATASKRKERTFRTLHKCGKPINLAAKCPEHGLVESDELVKGFEFSKGQYVTIDPEELEAVGAERNKAITLSKFVPYDDVIPWVEKSYYLVPNEIVLNPYLLIYNSMLKTGLAGIGQAALWGKEYPVAAHATKDGIVLALLFCHDEVSSASELREKLTIATKPGEQKQADQFVGILADRLDPEQDLVSVSGERIDEFLAAKVAGEEIKPLIAYDAPEPTLDLTSALKDSIAAAKKVKEQRKKVKV
jgi:DNA end-binding protein Ku